MLPSRRSPESACPAREAARLWPRPAPIIQVLFPGIDGAGAIGATAATRRLDPTGSGRPRRGWGSQLLDLFLLLVVVEVVEIVVFIVVEVVLVVDVDIVDLAQVLVVVEVVVEVVIIIQVIVIVEVL